MGRVPNPTFDFGGQAVVVTGGGRGLGAAIARAFLQAGADVVVCGRHRPDDATLPRASGSNGAERVASFFEADVREADQAAAVIDAARSRHGRLDVLVNNVGGSPAADAASVSPRLFEKVVALNLLAPFFCAQAANAVFQAAGAGSIVNIGSVSGVRPSPGTAAYGAAKAGLINLTQTLAIEWAPAVRVNCISAGLLDTGGGAEHYGGPEGMAAVAATVPLRRMGVPQDVVGLCLFLASPSASYVTGANLVVHGGGEWPAFLRAAAGTDRPGR